MAKKMLIDATHDEEVRVAVVDGFRLEEFDSETSTKKQIKGNIYLAKVVRIEPSLQAAFVEFGGNRHGFLPFGEIHPDYFRIPMSDRTQIDSEPIKAEDISLSEPQTEKRKSKKSKSKSKEKQSTSQSEDTGLATDPVDIASIPSNESGDSGIDLVDEDELPRRPRNYHYKIQEVIKRRQIMLIQVVKEERGNKGAALTTYLSLPGRYCVLMPNAGHRGGGISRKISEGSDRRRLRDILKELDIPEGMSLIVRTAGQERNRLEIRRDFDYLLRLWEEIRETTLQATAPALVYAEGDLIKRSIRDVYNRDIDQILIDGDEAYKATKNLMKALIPSHTKKVQPYKNTIPLFRQFKVEEQIDAMMNPMVKLPSGGSIVINSTEALVAIDVNSGRSTRERHIDETAIKTNLEAADEVARQMRLRDLAGLIVIDFIDMNDQKHIQAVEKRLREAVSRDRARIQLGHISQFGLLEMSRQRLRPSLLEAYSSICSHCKGSGLVRSVESMSLLVLRAIESVGIEGQSSEVAVTVPTGIDLYLLNQKRKSLLEIENRYKMNIIIGRDDTLYAPEYRIDSVAGRKPAPNSEPIQSQLLKEPVIIQEDEKLQPSTPSLEPQEIEKPQHEQAEGRGRRRRRRRPFSKRRDHDHHRDHLPVEVGQDVQSHPKKQSQVSGTIEEQIVTEIMGSVVPKGKKTPSSSDIEKKKPDQVNGPTDGSEGSRGDRSHRRRRRGRRQGSKPVLPESNKASSLTQNSDSKQSIAAKPTQGTVKVEKSIENIKAKLKEVSIPMTALPEGAESSSQKSPHSRWWKRLLES